MKTLIRRGLRPALALGVIVLVVLQSSCDALTGSNEAPTASITSPRSGTTFDAGEAVVFEGSATDPEDGELTGSALSWSSTVDGSLGTGVSVTRTNLSTGLHRVALTATDSDGDTAMARVTVVVNGLPEPAIVRPTDGAAFLEGEPIVFEGSATDPEDGVLTELALVWSSDVDGDLGTGSTLTRSDLTPGAHTVTLAATDGDGGSAEATVAFGILARPSVSIGAPEDGAIYEEGEEVVFRGAATDADGAALTGASLVWTSDLDGVLGTGETVRRSDLSVGYHTVTLEATDTRGATATATVSLNVGLVVLTLGEPYPGLDGPAESDRYFQVTVPAAAVGAPTGAPGAVRSGSGATKGAPATSETASAASPIRLRVLLTGGNGDADMVVRYGARPTLTGFSQQGEPQGEFDCGSFNWGNEEVCEYAEPAAGDYFILLRAFTDYRGAILLVETESPTDGCTLESPDADGDRLPDCAETDTGVFRGPLDTGTDPAMPDTDLDGIGDGDEVLGTLAGLDLPALGVSPLRQDILLEYDWFVDDVGCALHSHQPTAAQVDAVTTMFANAPVPNPDGSTGIHVIHDYGQGGAFSGGNRIDDADGVIAGGVSGEDYQEYKAANFDLEREGYFHYVLLPHHYNTDSGSSGQAEVYGDDLIVSLQCFLSTTNVANTIAHELGHNLGLRHGGDTPSDNYKPNYNSLMNYRYQFAGVDSDCTPPGDGVMDFSHGTRISLDENDLDEADGICGSGSGGWDWNGDGDAVDVGVVADINVDSQGEGDGYFRVLYDYDDWSSLILFTVKDGDGAPPPDAAPRIVSCQRVPDHARH